MSKIINYYRHGETAWNKEGRLQGWLDSDLTSNGIKQAMAVDWDPEIVFCSDLNRAVQTAQLMFPNKPIHKSKNLREINLGHWQGCFISDLQNDDQYRRYMKSPHLFINSTQESFEDVTNRMVAFHDYLSQLPYNKIAVVSHGVALACLFTALNNQPNNQLWDHLLSSASFLSIEI